MIIITIIITPKLEEATGKTGHIVGWDVIIYCNYRPPHFFHSSIPHMNHLHTHQISSNFHAQKNLCDSPTPAAPNFNLLHISLASSQIGLKRVYQWLEVVTPRLWQKRNDPASFLGLLSLFSKQNCCSFLGRV